MKSYVQLAMSLCALVCVDASAQEVYKIVGPDGKVSYTQKLPEDPKGVSVVRMDVPSPEASKEIPAPPKKAQAKKEPDSPKDVMQSAKDWFNDVSKSVSGTIAGFTSGSAKNPEKAKAEEKNKDPHFGQPILFYKMIGCVKCDEARAYLRDRKIAYRGLDIGTEDGRRAMAEVDKQAALPLLIARGKKYTGFSADAYDEVFRDYTK